jgi:hypothetical protein
MLNIALGVSIFLAVLTEGMVVSGADIRYLFSKPAQLLRTLLAMNVLGPIVAVVVCSLFSLHPAVIVALVTLAIAPVGGLCRISGGVSGCAQPDRPPPDASHDRCSLPPRYCSSGQFGGSQPQGGGP